VVGEGTKVQALSPVSRRLVLDGQRRLRMLIDDVIAGSPAGASECACLARTGDIMRSLARQARLEIGLLKISTR
jgi:hypothetical protein